jgi:glycosyltransferase involved in cell wall biosynthesis
MTTPLISIVIPCYNYGRYLPDCLNSIFQQQGDFENLEVIAIDDCSSDDTWEILNACKDSRLKLFRHEKNQGHVITVNEGLTAAEGQFIARIDPDDRYRANFLSTLVPLFDNPKVGLALGDAAMIDSEGRITLDCCPRPFGGKAFAGWALLDILHKNFVCAPTAIGRREAWRQHLPIWEGLAFNDIYFNMMIARDWHYSYVPAVVADYRVHNANHHTKITINKSEEPSLMRVLDWIFAHPESDSGHERLKQNARTSVYGSHYLDLAEKYFGAQLEVDARRCYLRAVRNKPGLLLNSGVMRRLTATFIGLQRYNKAKSQLFGKQLSQP